MTDLLVFLTDWALKSAAIAVLALVCAFFVRRRSAATKHFVWRTSLIAIVLLPVAMMLAPRIGAPTVMEPIQAPVRVAFSPLEPVRGRRPIQTPRVAQILAASASEGTLEGRIIGMAYLLGLAAFLGVWLTGYAKIQRIAATAVPNPGLTDGCPVLVAVAPELGVPVTFGFFKPVILLPRVAEGWREERIRAAILHEKAHIARYDWAWQTVALWVRALQWFNPALWFVTAALRGTSETSADDEVLAAGFDATLYAGELLGVAEAAHFRLSAATTMARPGGVASRIRRIISKGIDRQRPGRRFVAALGSLFAVAALVFAAGTIAQAAAHLSSQVHLAGALRPGIKLKSGAVVQLVYLSESDDQTGRAWRPDGSPATKADIGEFGQLGLGLAPGGMANMRRIFLNFKISNCPDVKDPIYRIKGHPEAQYNGGSGQYRNDTAHNRDVWEVPRRLSALDVDCAIASGPFRTIARGAIGDRKLKSIVPNVKDIDEVYEQKGANVSVTLPPSFSGKQLCLIAYDDSGKAIASAGGSLPNIENGRITVRQPLSFNFGNLPSSAVGFELGARDFEIVTLTGIHLQPKSMP